MPCEEHVFSMLETEDWEMHVIFNLQLNGYWSHDMIFQIMWSQILPMLSDVAEK